MRKVTDQNISGASIIGVICAAATVLVFVLAAERSGLPIQWSEWFVRATLFLTLLAAIWLGRSAVERLFFGRAPSLTLPDSGFILGAIIYSASRFLPGANQAETWFSIILGTILGITTVHLLLRQHDKRTRSNQAHPLRVVPINAEKPRTRLLLGAALCTLGIILALPSLSQVLMEIAPALNASKGLSLSYVLILSVLAVALGGANGALTMAAMLALIAGCGAILALLIGLVAYSTLPLPGFDSPATLQAIIEIKSNLGLSNALVFQQWPSFSSLVTLHGLTALILSAVVTGAVALSCAPAIQLRRRGVTASACITLVIIPLIIIALSSYAIEAISEQLLGAAINNPPAALLETARLGIVTVCGAYPETAEALRIQCGVAPRDTTLIDISRIQLQADSLLGSLPVSLGYTSIVSQTVRLFPLALSFIGVVIGIWFTALGLGRYILGKNKDTPGLASHRIALMRMSAVFAAALLALFSQYNITLSPAINGAAAGLAAGVILVIQGKSLVSSMRAPRQSPQPA